MTKLMRVQGVQTVRRQPKDGEGAVGVSVKPEAVAFKKGDTAVTKTVTVTAAWGADALPYGEPGAAEAYFTCSLLNGQGTGYILDGRMAWRFDVSADNTALTYSLRLTAGKEVNEELWFDVNVWSRDGGQMMPARRMKINVTTTADGEKGDKGDKGDAGAAGLDGCIVRTTEWEAGKEYRNDEGLETAAGLRYVDVVTVTRTNEEDGTTVQTAWVCRETHVSSLLNAPTDVTAALGYRYWAMIDGMKPIRTSFLLAENAVIRFGQANRLAVMDKEGKKVQACLQGTDTEDGDVLWIGGATAEKANFAVGYDGTMRAKNADISGRVTATGGRIGSFMIDQGWFRNEANSFWLTGESLSFGLMNSAVGQSGFYTRYGNINSTYGMEMYCYTTAANAAPSTGIRVQTLTDMGKGTENQCLWLSAMWGANAGEVDLSRVTEGNHAIRIDGGDVLGLRPSLSVPNTADYELTDLHHTVLCSGGNGTTLTLPAEPKIGQEYLIIQGGGDKVTVKAGGKSISARGGDGKDTFTSATRGQFTWLVWDGEVWRCNYVN